MEIIAKDILDSGLEIVGLQEVVSKTTAVAYRELLKELSEKTGYAYYQFFPALPSGSGALAGGYGLGILSKYPITETELIKLTSETATKKYEQRVMGRAAIDVNGLEVNFFVTHLSYEITEVRKNQFAQINEIFKTYDNFLLVGDFNTNIYNEYKAIEGGVNLIRSKKYITFPEDNLSIDNIVYSANDWTFGTPNVVATGHSDHNMIWADGTFIPNGVKVEG
jgi:endonuclease/exonuclease/phosphatase family metal-dependent hydrolase